MLVYHCSTVEDVKPSIVVPNVYWNMWTIRQYPYNQLVEELLILLVSSEAPQSGKVMHG